MLPAEHAINLATNPKDAWTLWNEYHPGLLILDNSMPNENDGLHLIKRIRKSEGSQPLIILYSGDAVDISLPQTLDFVFVQKGSPPAILQRAIVDQHKRLNAN